jgi:hypothetical protein
MKYLFGALALLLVCSSFAYADETSYATSNVYVDVVANIAVQPLAPNFGLGDIQTGDFFGEIPFRVDANTEAVTFWAEASYLYKGDDPSNPEVAPILLSQGYGTVLGFDHANPTGGGDTNLAYVGTTDIDGFLGYVTEEQTYESSQSGHFSQDGLLTVTWYQDDPEKPTGEYSGLVRLHAMVAI